MTAFMGEQGYEAKYKKGTSQLIDANAPTRTSENDFVVVPKNIIARDSEKVNRKTKKISIDPTWTNEKGKKRTYGEKLTEKKVHYDHYEMDLGEAINLYLVTKRAHNLRAR